MYNFKNWLYKYNSDTFFKDFINNKYKNLKIKKNKKNINNNLELQKENIKKECQEKNLNCDTNFILDDLLKLTNLTENEITINNYLIKFFKQNIKINLNIYIIYSKYSVKYKQYLSKNNKNIKIDKLLLNNINDIQKINIKNNTDIIFIHYREAYGKNYILNRFKQNLKIFNKVLNNTLVNIIVITINLSITNLIRDFLVLLNNYCTIYFLLDYRYTEVQWLNVKLVCSNFTKIDELKEKIKDIIDLDIESNEEGILDEDVSGYEIVKYYDKMTDFIYNRYINFYDIFKGRELVEEEKDMIIQHNAQGILQQGIKIDSKNMKWLSNTINNNLVEIDKNKIKVKTKTSYKVADYLFKFILKYKTYNILQVGLEYGISSLLMSFALKKMKKEYLLGRGQLIIYKDKSEDYGDIAKDNLKKANIDEYIKISNNIIDKKYDLISIGVINLININILNKLINLLNINGFLIFTDINLPIVLDFINYIDKLKNFQNIQKTKYLTVYIKLKK